MSHIRYPDPYTCHPLTSFQDLQGEDGGDSTDNTGETGLGTEGDGTVGAGDTVGAGGRRAGASGGAVGVSCCFVLVCRESISWFVRGRVGTNDQGWQRGQECRQESEQQPQQRRERRWERNAC